MKMKGDLVQSCLSFYIFIHLVFYTFLVWISWPFVVGVAGNGCFQIFVEWATSLIHLYTALKKLGHDFTPPPMHRLSKSIGFTLNNNEHGS